MNSSCNYSCLIKEVMCTCTERNAVVTQRAHIGYNNWLSSDYTEPIIISHVALLHVSHNGVPVYIMLPIK